jgi:hypothetical protein
MINSQDELKAVLDESIRIEKETGINYLIIWELYEKGYKVVKK